jgi:hypothetical protein
MAAAKPFLCSMSISLRPPIPKNCSWMDVQNTTIDEVFPGRIFRFQQYEYLWLFDKELNFISFCMLCSQDSDLAREHPRFQASNLSPNEYSGQPTLPSIAAQPE